MVVCLPSPNSYTKALSPSVAVFRDGDFKEIVKFKWGDKGEALIQQD
jgi:hypothetical protein